LGVCDDEDEDEDEDEEEADVDGVPQEVILTT
jgi:hypothetical protein